LATKLAFRAKVLEKAILRMLEDGKTTSTSELWGWLNRFWDRILGLGSMFFKPNMLKDKNVAVWFYVHPLIKYLGEDNFYSKPAYITAQNFSKVMIDLLKGFEDTSTPDVQRISTSVRNGTIYQLPICVNADSANMAIQALRFQLCVKKGTSYTVKPDATVSINTDTKLFLQSIWAESNADINTFKTKLEQWYDDTMDRASGWYKRYTQFILLLVGFTIAVIFNVDTIAVYKTLSKDKTARDQLVQMAIKDNETIKTAIETINKSKNDTSKTKKDTSKYQDYENSTFYHAEYVRLSKEADSAKSVLGFGWRKSNNRNGLLGIPYQPRQLKQSSDWWIIIFGWLLTALAISLGAPFWFDLLNKLMQLRGGNKIDSSDGGTADVK